MGFKTSAFVTPTFRASAFTGAPLSQVTSQPVMKPLLKKRQASKIICSAATKDSSKGGKKKSAPPLVFAVDMKGNFVWDLRGATAEDASAVSALIGPKFPHAIVSSFIGDSDCCVVCEASVKGTKKGEGYSGRVMGAVLVDVSTEVKDKEEGFKSGLVKKAELLAVVVDSALPSVEDVRKKLLLGAMKKLKTGGVVSISTNLASSEDEKISLLKQCFFKGSTTEGNRVSLKCNLVAENPDPQKKVM